MGFAFLPLIHFNNPKVDLDSKLEIMKVFTDK